MSESKVLTILAPLSTAFFTDNQGMSLVLLFHHPKDCQTLALLGFKHKTSFI